MGTWDGREAHWHRSPRGAGFGRQTWGSGWRPPPAPTKLLPLAVLLRLRVAASAHRPSVEGDGHNWAGGHRPGPHQCPHTAPSVAGTALLPSDLSHQPCSRPRLSWTPSSGNGPDKQEPLNGKLPSHRGPCAPLLQQSLCSEENPLRLACGAPEGKAHGLSIRENKSEDGFTTCGPG